MKKLSLLLLLLAAGPWPLAVAQNPPIVVGNTQIQRGVNGDCLYDNAGRLGVEPCGGGSGTVTSIATGCGLSGGTITTSGTLIASEAVNPQVGATYALLAGDCGKSVLGTRAGVMAWSIAQAGSAGFPAGYFVDLQNDGTGTLTLTPATSTVDSISTLTLQPGQGVRLISDGANYFTALRGIGGIGGSISTGQVGVGTGTNTIGGLASTTLAPTPGALSSSALSISPAFGESNTWLKYGTDGFAQFVVTDAQNIVTFVHCTSATCSTKVTAIMGTADGGNRYSSLALGSDDLARFIYQGMDGLHFVQCTAVNRSCSTKNDNLIVAMISTYEVGLILKSDIGVFAYSDSGNTISVNVCANAACSSLASTNSVTVAPNGVYCAGGSCIFLNSATGFPTLFALDSSNNEIYAVDCGQTACSSTVSHDLGLAADYYLSIGSGADTFLRVLLADTNDSTTLKVIRCKDSGCATFQVDSLEQQSNGFLSLGMSGNIPTYAVVEHELLAASDTSVFVGACQDQDCATVASDALQSPVSTGIMFAGAFAGSTFTFITGANVLITGTQWVSTYTWSGFVSSPGVSLSGNVVDGIPLRLGADFPYRVLSQNGTFVNFLTPAYFAGNVGPADGSFPNGSLRLGIGSQARSTEATSFGTGAQANGTQTAAFGKDAHANSPGASAFGDGAVAGDNATALGVIANCPNASSTCVGAGATVTGNHSAAFGQDAHAACNNCGVMSGPGDGPYFYDEWYWSSPATTKLDQTISPGDVVGSNLQGSAARYAGGQSTGTGVGGDVCFQVSLPGMTGAAQNPLIDVLCARGATGIVEAKALGTITNCSNAASPAVCASAPAGAVAIPTGVTTVSLVVNTTSVTANSEIRLQADDSLTIAATTCNSTLATLVGGLAVTARTPGVSFTITYNGTIASNPLCVSYAILN